MPSIMAATLLASIGYFDKHPWQAKEANLSPMFDVLKQCGHDDIPAIVTGLCKACARSNQCPTGQVILRRP